MGKYSRLGKNTVYVFIGNIGAKMIGLLMLPLYTRWLSVEEYGVTDIIYVYVTLLVGIVSCCIAEALFIFPKDQDKSLQTKYFSSAVAFIVASLFFGGVLSAALNLATNYFGWQNSYCDNIGLIYFFLAATILQQMAQQFVRSIDLIKIYSSTGLVMAASQVLLSWLLIPSRGVTGFVEAMALSYLLAMAYSVCFSRAYTYLSFRAISREHLREMLKYSMPLIPNGIMWWLVAALNRPIMENSLDLHSIGIFAVANKFPAIIVLVFMVFVSSWQISVIEEYGKDGFVKFYNSILRIVLAILFLIFWIMTISSKLLVIMFASVDFYGAWSIIPMLALGAIAQCLSSFFGTPFSAARISKYFFYSSVWGAVAAIVFNIILIPKFGTMGAATAVLLSFTVMLVSRLGYSWKYAPLTRSRDFLMSLLLMTMIPVIYIKIENMFILLPIMLVILILYVAINRYYYIQAFCKIRTLLKKK